MANLNVKKIAEMKEMRLLDHRILWMVLSLLNEDERVFMAQTYIAKTLGTSSAQVSSSVSRLHRLGVVEKIRISGINGFMLGKEIIPAPRKKAKT